MTDIKEFFIASNTVSNAPNYDSNVLSTLIHTVESFCTCNLSEHLFDRLL